MNIPRTKATIWNIDPKREVGEKRDWFRPHLHLPLKLIFSHFFGHQLLKNLIFYICIQGSFSDWIVWQIKDPIGPDGFVVVVWRAATPSATAAG